MLKDDLLSFADLLLRVNELTKLRENRSAELDSLVLLQQMAEQLATQAEGKASSGEAAAGAELRRLAEELWDLGHADCRQRLLRLTAALQPDPEAD